MAYTLDSKWRSRDKFITGRSEIITFLRDKWKTETGYRLRKTLWAYTDNRIAVRFEYEWHDENNQWWRSYGNESWQFDENGLMEERHASINDVPIKAEERRIF